jgi:ABC-type lipoprotein export system ATPase subunit
MTGIEQHEPGADKPGGSQPAGAAIRCVGLVRIYQAEGIEVVALQGLDLEVEPGELVAVVGASGSGKSTLLNVLAGLDVPTAGQVLVGELDLLTMSAPERIRYRRDVVGFVWQQTARNLLPYLSALENVALPLALRGAGRRARSRRARQLLDQVGLGGRTDHRPSQLAGGEQQRVAIAVALANEPALLLADEPTGELDSATAGEVMAMLKQATADLGATGVIVSHDPAVSELADRTITIRDGRVASETLVVAGTPSAGRSGPERREFAVLDRAGRLQLPDQHVRQLSLRRRVALELAEDHIVVRPGPTGEPAPMPAATEEGR